MRGTDRTIDLQQLRRRDVAQERHFQFHIAFLNSRLARERVAVLRAKVRALVERQVGRPVVQFLAAKLDATRGSERPRAPALPQLSGNTQRCHLLPDLRRLQDRAKRIRMGSRGHAGRTKQIQGHATDGQGDSGRVFHAGKEWRGIRHTVARHAAHGLTECRGPRTIVYDGIQRKRQALAGRVVGQDLRGVRAAVLIVGIPGPLLAQLAAQAHDTTPDLGARRHITVDLRRPVLLYQRVDRAVAAVEDRGEVVSPVAGVRQYCRAQGGPRARRVEQVGVVGMNADRAVVQPGVVLRGQAVDLAPGAVDEPRDGVAEIVVEVRVEGAAVAGRIQRATVVVETAVSAEAGVRRTEISVLSDAEGLSARAGGVGLDRAAGVRGTIEDDAVVVHLVDADAGDDDALRRARNDRRAGCRRTRSLEAAAVVQEHPRRGRAPIPRRGAIVDRLAFLILPAHDQMALAFEQLAPPRRAGVPVTSIPMCGGPIVRVDLQAVETLVEQDVDHTRDGIGAVNRGRSARHHLHLIDQDRWNEVQIDALALVGRYEALGIDEGQRTRAKVGIEAP